MPSRTYKVAVRGRLSPGVVAACEAFEAVEFDQGMTHLVGLAPDQKVLHRLFRVFGDLNVELISVNPVTQEAFSSKRRFTSFGDGGTAKLAKRSPPPDDHEASLDDSKITSEGAQGRVLCSHPRQRSPEWLRVGDRGPDYLDCRSGPVRAARR